jgi:hypothetical protein
VPPKKGTPEYDEWKSSSRSTEWILNQTKLKRPDVSERNRLLMGTKHPEISDRQRGEKNHKYRKSPTYEYLTKLVEAAVGGFWYGNVKYPKRKKLKYCNIFYQMRDEGRIGACWEFKSVLSGETKDLCYHHVYYQPKACCEFDKDIGGYYVWLNIGASHRPKWYKYYIPGDPNKFVPLTRSENSMVNGDKLKWIKIFEDIIDKNGGKCYLTKEEMVEYNHRQ